MNIKTITISKDKKFLSQVYNELPENCILDKGITGCGGTTVEIRSKRNSLILVPTINLVKNKMKQENIFGLYGNIPIYELEKYLDDSTIEYKKIIATYDSLEKLMNYNLFDYFLLIDEYHILFNSYSFRGKAIRYILNNYNKFKKYCFMTATNIDESCCLKELKEIPIIKLE